MTKAITTTARARRTRRRAKRQGLTLHKCRGTYELLDAASERNELPGTVLVLEDIERLMFAGRNHFGGYIPEAEMANPRWLDPSAPGCPRA